MELIAWVLSIDFNESLLLGIQKENFEGEESLEVDWSLCVLFIRLRLTLIYNQNGNVYGINIWS